MQYTDLSNTDIEVSRLCVGCMSFCKAVIASKVYFNKGRLKREAIMCEIDGTLKRLGTHYLDDAAGVLDVNLTAEDVSYIEEPYMPHKVVGAITANPPQGVMLLDEKK